MPALITQVPVLKPVVDAVSKSRTMPPELHNAAIQVVVLEMLSESQLAAIRSNPARWSDDPPQIEILPPFFEMSPSSWNGILAHELGEYAARNKSPALSAVASMFPDLQADYLACQLGFEESILVGREDRGPTYAAALRTWPNPEEYRTEMSKWRNQSVAHIRPS